MHVGSPYAPGSSPKLKAPTELKKVLSTEIFVNMRASFIGAVSASKNIDGHDKKHVRSLAPPPNQLYRQKPFSSLLQLKINTTIDNGLRMGI